MQTYYKQLLTLFLLLPTLVLAQTWQAENDNKQMAVLELFTSEGCGLCPAADRWVHALPEQGIDDNDLIILAFHIDYLNEQKGWIDHFASPVFSDRQRQLANLNLYQSVYTPEFVVSGEVIHNWEKHVKKVVKAVNSFESEVTISLNIKEQGEDEIVIGSHIQVQGDDNRDYAVLYLAVTENDITSKVNGGDNRGATFHHQNLVRIWLGPFELNKTGETDLNTVIRLDDDWNPKTLSVVALVQNLDDSFVLQGLKLPLLKED